MIARQQVVQQKAPKPFVIVLLTVQKYQLNTMAKLFWEDRYTVFSWKVCIYINVYKLTREQIGPAWFMGHPLYWGRIYLYQKYSLWFVNKFIMYLATFCVYTNTNHRLFSLGIYFAYSSSTQRSSCDVTNY